MKTYKCVCHVCGIHHEKQYEFFSSGLSVQGADGLTYPGHTCGNHPGGYVSVAYHTHNYIGRCTCDRIIKLGDAWSREATGQYKCQDCAPPTHTGETHSPPRPGGEMKTSASVKRVLKLLDWMMSHGQEDRSVECGCKTCGDRMSILASTARTAWICFHLEHEVWMRNPFHRRAK